MHRVGRALFSPFLKYSHILLTLACTLREVLSSENVFFLCFLQVGSERSEFRGLERGPRRGRKLQK